MKKILLIDGHPSDRSFCKALTDKYELAARSAGFQVTRLNIRDLTFNPNLIHGYTEIQELEPDLVKAQNLIQDCEHLTLVYPVWWGSMPALLKGFFDRCWLPGFAFKYHQNDPFWDRLLVGRSARLIITSDAPYWYNVLAYLNGPYTVVKKMIFRFCGFKPVKVTPIGSVKSLSESKRLRHLAQVEKLGSQGR